MDDEAALLLVVGVGAIAGWGLRRWKGRFPKRMGVIIAALAVGVPVVAFAIAVAISSDTLAMLAGLSLMAELALAVPLGIGMALGWALGPKSQEDTSLPIPTTPHPAEYAPAPKSPSSIPPPTPTNLNSTLSAHQRTVLLAMAVVGSLFWVVIWVGFRLHDQPPPQAISVGIIPASLVLIAALVQGVRSIWQNRDSLRHAFALPDISFDPFAGARHRKWLASLAAGPCRQRYAAMVEAGDTFWTAERIEYDLDPNATTCCEHLAPIESAMRASAIIVRMSGAGIAVARCRIDTDALPKRFELPPSGGYQELQIYDRSIHDPPEARLHCGSCPSSIWVTHPSVAAPDTPAFPST